MLFNFLFPLLNTDLIYELIIYIIDINECSNNNGGCSSNCTDTAGSFYCSCPAGSYLTPSKLNCLSMNS